MRYSFIIICIVMYFSILHADFSHKAPITTVQNNGEYRISLPPDVVMFTRSDFGDIRIHDNDGKEIPYLLYREEAISRSKLFYEYTIRANRIEKDKTVLILENIRKIPISNVCLIVRNSDVRKTAALSGSDDGVTWYAIKNNYVFESVYSDTHTAETMQISFPLSDYRYLKLEINDKRADPLQITSVGYYDYQSEEGKYTEITGASFSQRVTEKNKNTVVTVEFDQPVRADQIILIGDMESFYRRNATVSVVSEPRQYAPVTYENHVRLSSSEDTVLTTRSLTVKKLEIVIDNGNDAPLMLSKVKFYQLNTYILTELKQGSYTLFFGDESLTQPVYDIVHKKDELMKTMQPLSLQPIIELPKKQPGFFGSIYFLWITLIIVGGLLAYFTVTMIKDMKKRENE